MKALSLWQPWASLMAIINPATGRPWKTIETRSWSTSYRGPLVICAARKVIPGSIGPFGVGKDRGRPAYLSHPYSAMGRHSTTVPLGCGLVVVNLVDVLPIVDPDEPSDEMINRRPELVASAPEFGLRIARPSTHSAHGFTLQHCEDQRPFGDFTPGRFAWITEDAELFDEPVPVRGRQGLWTWPDA